MATTIKDIRAKYPQYDKLSDQALADALHKKFYSNMDQNDFYGRIGLNTSAPSDHPEETGGFSAAMTKDVAEGVPKPSTQSVALADQVTDDRPARIRAIDPLVAAMATDSLPNVDTKTPPSPGPTPAALDPLPPTSMGGSGDDQVMWARREIARQMAKTGEVPVHRDGTVDPLVAAMAGEEYTPTGEAILSELGNAPERVQRGFAGNKLAAAEKGIKADLETIGRAKTEAQDPSAALAAVQQEKANLGLRFSESTDITERNALEAQIRALGQEEQRLSHLVAVPGMADRAVETNRDQLAFNQRNRSEAQTRINTLEEAMTPVNPKPGLSRAVVSGIASIGDMAPGLVTTLVTKNPLPMMAYLGAYSRGSTYVDKRADGYSPEKAASAANLYALSETIPELLPLHVILKEGGGGLYKIVGGAATEGASEVLTQGLQTLVDMGVLDERMSWAEASEAMIESGMAGSVMGGLMGGGAVLTDNVGESLASRQAKKGTPADPQMTPFQPAPDQAQEDPLVSAMSPDAPVDQTQPAPTNGVDKPMADQQAEPPKIAQNIPENIPETITSSKDDSNESEKTNTPEAAPADGQFEVMDEIETVDGQPQPTGRRVRVNLQTGEAEVVEQESGSVADAAGDPGSVGGAGSQPQASVEGASRTSASPAAEPQIEPPADPEGRKVPRRVFLTHDQTVGITTDPKTFQYKGGTDEEGVSDRLKGATRFDPNRAGQAVLFERKDGTLVVADGHQRAGLARRSAEAGQEDVGGMAAVIYREADGYTPEEVMVEAALKNIGEDSGTATDAARVLRARKETVAELGLPPNSAKVRTADGLRRLSDQAFGMVANGVASERDGAAVGKSVTDAGLHADVLALLTKLKPENEAQAVMIARDAASSATTETQDSLFGPEQVQQSLFLERARVLDGAMKSLGKNISTFRTLIDRSETITSAGNKLAKKENASQLDDSTKVRQYLSSQANMKGPISDALTNAARELKSGRSVGKAIEGFIRDARAALSGGSTKSESPAGRGSPDAQPEQAKPEPVTPAPEPQKSPDGDLLSAMMPEVPAQQKPQPVPKEQPVAQQTTPKPQQKPSGRPQTDLFDQSGARGPGERQTDIEDLIAEKKTETPVATIKTMIAHAESMKARFVADGDTAAPSFLDLMDGTEGHRLLTSMIGKTTEQRRKLADDWVLAQGKKSGSIEHLVIFDRDGNPVLIGRGKKSFVGFDEWLVRAGAARELSYATHNHPKGGSFSAPDLDMMYLLGIEIVAIGHNGHRHSATVPDDHRALKITDEVRTEIRSSHDRASGIANRELQDKLNAQTLSTEEFDQRVAIYGPAQSGVASLALHRMGVIRYSGDAQKALDAAEVTLEQFYPTIVERVAPGLRRAGFSIPEEGDRGATGQDEASQTDRTGDVGNPEAGRPAGDSDRRGRVSASAVTPKKPATTGNPTEKIDDFGEKITGAAKDRWTEYAKRLDGIPDADVIAEPLSKSFPEPNYQGMLDDGTDPWKVAFIRAARDMIPTKPQKSWKLKDWSYQVITLRKFSADLLNGAISQDALMTALDAPQYIRLRKQLEGAIDLYLAVRHERSLKGMALSSNSYSLYRGVAYNPHRVIWEVEQKTKATAFSNMPRVMVSAETREEAIAKFKEKYNQLTSEGKGNRAPTRFVIYSRASAGEKVWILGKKVGSTYIDLKAFTDVKEARTYATDHHADLEAQLEKLKDGPSERRAENSPRVGVDHRMGADVTPQMFADTFGFRGVQFGNYVENDRRRADLNQAYDALMDLAGIIDVPPRAISLNGQLGLAFGARGRGGKRPASAHYEPGQIVINLTKTSGAGSLAHEWFHAIDNYFERERGRPIGYITDHPRTRADVQAEQEIRAEVLEALQGVRKAINATSLKARSAIHDQTRSKPYWSTGIEMHARSFESYVIAKLQDQGASNDYLANIVDEAVFNAEAALMGNDKPSYPYPIASEVPEIRAAFDNLFSVIETRETPNGLAFFQREDPFAFDDAAPLSHEIVSRYLPQIRAELDRLDLKRVRLYQDNTGAEWQGMFLQYSPNDMEIIIGASMDPMKTIHHEVIHILRSMDLFTPAEWQALEAMALKKWMNEFNIEGRYPTLTLPEQLEEAIAEAFAEAAAGRRRPDAPLIGQAFRKISRLLEAIRNLFRGAGFQSADDIFGKVYDGKLTKRAAEARAASRGGDTAFQPIASPAQNAAQEKNQEAQNSTNLAEQTPALPMLTDAQFETIKSDLQTAGRSDPEYELSEVPPVLRQLGVDKRMIIRKSVFEKARDKHGLTEEETLSAVRGLYNPVAVFDSDTLKDSFTALVDTGTNKTIVVALHPDAESGRMAVTVIASVYAKNSAGIIPEWMRKGLTRYLNKRSAEAWFQSRRLQLPREGTAHRRKIKILQHRDVFKGQGGKAKMQAARLPSRQARAHMATSMQGAIHVPDRRVWEELHRAGAPIWTRMREGAAALNDTLDRMRIKLQDRFLPVMRAQQAIERTIGAPLPEQYDAYLVETTFSGKAGRNLFDIDETFTKPIIGLIAESDGALTVDQVSEYLTARHAEERNDRIAKINPKMPDGGSGMMTADAKAILAQATSGPHAARLKKIGDLIDQMREWTLKLRVDSGLMTQGEADLWRKQYQHYVPLKGFDETEHNEAFLDVAGIGRRLNVRGEESKRALGRRSLSFNTLQTAITQAQEVAIRAEKARVGAALYRLARDYPSKAMWEVKPVETARYFNKTTGLVETRAVNPLSMILQPNELAVKVDGAEHRIIFHDPRLARSAGSVGADQMGWFVQAMSVMGRWFSMTRTMLNPEFVISNAFRDMTAAQVNIRDFGEGDRNAIAKSMIKNWPKAFAGVYRGSGGKFDTDWSKHYDEFTRAGAKVDFWTLEQPEAGLKDLDKRIWLKSGSRARRLLKATVSPSAFFSTRDNGVLHFVERTNMAVDNAIRLAAFVAARKSGWSEARAAALSKNLTVNFNRRGEASPTINALYTFFNAAVQGSTTTATALIRSRKVRHIALTMIAAGLLNDLANAYLSHEDDDDVLAYDKIPDFQSQRAVQFMLGRDSENALSIPMPYGYNIFPYLGQQIGKVSRGVKSPEEAMSDLAVALFGSFSPVQGGDAYAFFAPTVVDPVLEMARNVDWLGRPIMPDYDGDKKPDSQKFFGGASEASKAVAEAANAMTGGTKGSSGWLDVSPEYIDHTAAFIFGSMGSFAGRSADLVAKASAGNLDEITPNDVPMLRVLVKDTYPGLDRDRYFRFRDLVERAAFAVKTAKETGEEVPEIMKKWASLTQTLKAAEKRRKAGEDIYLRFNRKVTETFGAIGE